MATFQIGDLAFHVSPVAIMQCWIGIGWIARGSSEDIEEFRTFTREFFPFLIAQDCELPIEKFCTNAINKMDQIISEHHLKTDFVTRFVNRLHGRLTPENQRSVSDLAEKYSVKVRTWLDSPLGKVGADAVVLLNDWGLQPPYRGLTAINEFGNAIFGEYVHDLSAVCVQLDVIAKSETPEVQFLETLLHEEIHAAIHRQMGNDDGRPELTWMNELCAVLTSQEALRVSAKKSLNTADTARLNAALDRIRKNQQYGELAEAVLRDTGDALVALKTWKRIFALPDEGLRDYARGRVIKPILHDLGWNVTFPYHYGKKYVTVFI